MPDFECEVEKQNGRATDTPEQRATTPLEECAKPHAQAGVERGKGLRRECSSFCSPLPLH